jgi:hypothetical protein
METKPYEKFDIFLTSLQVPDTARTGYPRFYEVLGFAAYFGILAG